MKTTTRGNAIIIHGGGLVDPSKSVLMRLAKNLKEKRVYNKIFIGRYSFESLYTPVFWLEYYDELEDFVKDKRGTFFGTCRGIDLTNSVLSDKAITCLKDENITTVIVAGGDGSARQVAEINDTFVKNGINIIFAVPLTIDGINGGLSIGIKEAVKESIRQIENIASTSLLTRDNEAYGVVMVELQGRNRDDIIANVLKDLTENLKVADIYLHGLLLRVVPANYKTNESKLLEEINKCTEKTLILISEGADIKIPELTKKVNRKVRSLVVGHPSQSNGMTKEEDYHEWIDYICCNIIAKSPLESYCIVNNFGKSYEKFPIDYYARLNPRKGQKAELPYDLKELVMSYMTKWRIFPKLKGRL